MNQNLQEMGFRANFLERQLGELNHQLSELYSVKQGLEEIQNKKEGEEILVPLGAGVFTKAKYQEGKLLMNVGAQVVVEKMPKEALDLVQEQLNELEKIKEKMEQEFATIRTQLQIAQMQQA